MDILFFSDDADDGTIFIDTIFEINPETNCTIVASNENTLSAVNESASPIVFLDYNNLPEKFVKDCIKLIHSNRQSEIKVIIYASEHLFTKQNHEHLKNMGIKNFVMKTSDLTTLRKSVAESIKKQ